MALGSIPIHLVSSYKGWSQVWPHDTSHFSPLPYSLPPIPANHPTLLTSLCVMAQRSIFNDDQPNSGRKSTTFAVVVNGSAFALHHETYEHFRLDLPSFPHTSRTSIVHVFGQILADKPMQVMGKGLHELGHRLGLGRRRDTQLSV